MVFITEIKDSLPGWRREEEKNVWSIRYVLRPSSAYLAWVMIRLGVSCKMTVLIGLAVGLTGCVFIAFGPYWAVITGCLLLLLSAWLDYADGTVARATNTADKEGAYLDLMRDDIMVIAVPIAVGASASMLVWGLVLAVLGTWATLAITEGRYVFGEGDDVYRSSEWSLWRLIFIVGVNLQSLYLPVLLITAITNTLYIYLYLFILLTGVEIYFIILKRMMSARENKA